jgi:hypothetical protein
MSQYPNSGSLFPLDAKFKTSDKSPTMRGQIELGEDLCDYIQQQYRSGVEVKLDIAAWTQIAASSGKKFLSIKVQKEYVKDAKEKKVTSVQDMDDDIPF